MQAPAAATVAVASPKLYEQVAARLADAIASGTLRPGDRLPSIRRLSQQHRVSISTVLQAYAHLEAAGLLEARAQSGHYVRARRTPPEARAPRAPQETSAVTVSSLLTSIYTAGTKGMIDFGALYSPWSMLPNRRLGRLLAAEARASEYGGNETDLSGYLPLCQQIARRSLDSGCALGPEDILVTCGASEAMNLCLMAVARRGDTVAIESPTFFGILQMLEAHGLRALEIPNDPRQGMRLDALSAGLRRHRVAAVLSVTNFSNPSGSCMPDDHKQELVRMLARKEIPLIEDDIFGDLHHDPVRPRTAKSFDRNGLVLLCGSFSKTLTQGYRVGWVAPGRFLERVQLLKYAQSGPTTTLQQRAIARFLEGGGYDRHLRTLRRRLADSMGRTLAALGSHFPPGTRTTQPRGGMMVWVELPRRVSALELYRRALAERIVIAPGPIFSARQGLHNFIRLNTAQDWDERVERALQRLGQLANELAERA